MNTNLLSPPFVDRAALGTSLALVLAALVVAPVHAQTLSVSESASVNAGTAVYIPGSPNPNNGSETGPATFSYLNPVIASFNFSGDTAALASLAASGGANVVGISLPLYNFNTANVSGEDYNNVELVLSGTVNTANSLLGGTQGSLEILDTGILLNGYSKNYSAGVFNYSSINAPTGDLSAAAPAATLLTGYTPGSAIGVADTTSVFSLGGISSTSTGLNVSSSILDLLNDTGGLISASMLEETAYNDSSADAGNDANNFWFAGGSMTLAFAVPFTPMQWLGMGLIVLMAGLRLYYTGGLKQLRVLAGV
jgi:hypothetical protein